MNVVGLEALQPLQWVHGGALVGVQVVKLLKTLGFLCLEDK